MGINMQKYPARFDPADEGGYTVSFRDIPEALTQGDDLADAESMAVTSASRAIDSASARSSPWVRASGISRKLTV